MENLIQNFGVPETIQTQFLREDSEMIRVLSVQLQNPQRAFLFEESKKPHEVGIPPIYKSVWACFTCRILRKADREQGNARQPGSRVCHLHVRIFNEHHKIMITDPQHGHHHLCTGKLNAEIEAKRLQRKMNTEVKRGKKRPRQAYLEAASEIPREFRHDDDLQVAVEVAFPAYKKARRSLFRHSEQGIVDIPDLHNFPPELTKTYRGRYAIVGSRFENERWVLHESDIDSPLMKILASDLDLETLHQSEIWICDGTFKVTPPDFAQVYTIHAFGRFRPEVIPSCATFAIVSGIRIM